MKTKPAVPAALPGKLAELQAAKTAAQAASRRAETAEKVARLAKSRFKAAKKAHKLARKVARRAAKQACHLQQQLEACLAAVAKLRKSQPVPKLIATKKQATTKGSAAPKSRRPIAPPKKAAPTLSGNSLTIGATNPAPTTFSTEPPSKNVG